MLHEANIERKEISKLQKKILMTERNTVLYVLTPTHGNLGDHAITTAVISLLNELNLSYIEITTSELVLLEKHNKLYFLNHYPILVNGGGNIGTLWPKIEGTFRALIRCCPDSKILCLPNTAFFENSINGQKEYEKSKHIYRNHVALKICAREEVSYELLKKMHKDVVLIPDMALLLNKCENDQKRSGCLLCLRTDREKTRTDVEDKVVREQMNQIFGGRVSESDMYIGRRVPIERRELELENKFQEFRSAELVVTDRLHGMIFAAITGTPCIVLNSKSPKVKGCYKWLKRLEYIKFIDNVNQVTDAYNRIPKHENCYENRHLQKYYEELKEYIMEMVE